jgi:hypothetical protein
MHMSNTCGGKYALTTLFPIRSEAHHYSDLRNFLRQLDSEMYGSPLAQVDCIHMARFLILQDFFYEGLPAKRDHLQSRYLVFMCDFDGDSLEVLVDAMRRSIPRVITHIWQHCIDYPGSRHTGELTRYFERCQIPTTLFFADRPHDSVGAILSGLRMKRGFAEFVEQNQARVGSDFKRRFYEWWDRLAGQDSPHPGSL